MTVVDAAWLAVVDQHLDGIEERQLTSGRGDAFLAIVIRSEIGGVALHDGITQLGDAAHRRVAGEVGVDGGNGSGFYMFGGGEMRLTGAVIHQVGALFAELRGLVKNLFHPLVASEHPLNAQPRLLIASVDPLRL